MRGRGRSFFFFRRKEKKEKLTLFLLSKIIKKKKGVCVWKALRTIKDVDDAAWRHLGGVPVEEKDLPLAVPDVLAEEAAKAAAGKNGTENAGDDENGALDAATAVVAQGEQLVSADEEKAGTRKAQVRKNALPEVRASAMEEVAALARELDAMFLRRKEESERRREAQRELKSEV